MKWIGIILLILIAIFLILLLLLLFVPIRLRAEGHLRTEEEEKVTADGHVAVSWLLGFLRLEAGADRAGSTFRLLVLGLPLHPEKLFKKRDKEKPEKDKKAALTLEERCDKIIRTAEILTEEEHLGALKKGLPIVGKAIAGALPLDWRISGPAGFETPDLTGALMALDGMLCPFIGGHVSIEPHFEGKYLNLCGDLHGPVRLWPLAAGAVRLFMIRGLRELPGALKQNAGES